MDILLGYGTKESYRDIYGQLEKIEEQTDGKS